MRSHWHAEVGECDRSGAATPARPPYLKSRHLARSAASPASAPAASSPGTPAIRPRPRTAHRAWRRSSPRARKALASASLSKAATGVPAQRQTFCGLFRLVAAGLLVEAVMRQVIHAAARDAGKADPDEIDALIAWAEAHPSGAKLAEVRHAE